MEKKNSVFKEVVAERKNIALCIVIFMIIHGEMLFNKISWHDDIATLDGWPDSLGHGRFTYTIIYGVANKIAGLESLPVIKGAVGALFIVLIAYIIIYLFKIRNAVGRYGVLLICMSIPAITGNLGYIGTFSANMFGAFLAVLAAYYTITSGKKINLLFAAFLLGFAIGEYQCNLTFFLTILFCWFLKYLSELKTENKDIFKTIIRFFFVAVAGLIIYLVVLQIFLKTYDLTLTTYANTDTYGITNLQGYLERIKYAYSDFLNPVQTYWCMFPFHWGGWHKILLSLLLFGICLILIILICHKRIISAIFTLVCTCFIPMIFNFNFILYDIGPVHSLHQYHYVMLPILVIVLFNSVFYEVSISKFTSAGYIVQICKKANIIIVFFVLLLGCAYVRYDNICYMQAEMAQEQAISYFTALVSNIYNTDGYYSDISVCYVNSDDKMLSSSHLISVSDTTLVNPYRFDPTSTYTWKSYLYEWCNYEPAREVSYDDLSEETRQIIDEMPNYPDKGSIMVINDVLVVKF